MKNVTLAALSFALLVSAFFEAYGDADKPRIVNEFGERPVEKLDFKARGNVEKTVRESVPCHAYLTLQKAPTKALMERIERSGNLKIHSLSRIHRDGGKKHFTYLIRCHAGIARSRDLLAESGMEQIIYGVSPVEDNDKVTRKIVENSGFGKKENAGKNNIYAIVHFYPDFNRKSADSLIRIYCDSVIETASNGLTFLVTANPPKLLMLSRHEGVMFVREHIISNEPTIYDGRAMIGVDDVQQFDLQNTHFPPMDTSNWSPSNALTGDGISVGVYDVGFDGMRLDFREWNSQFDLSHYYSGMSDDDIKTYTVQRSNSDEPQWLKDGITDYHGTHVASIIGGNGWEQFPTSVKKYRYRGIAPKAKIYYVDDWRHPDIGNRRGNVSNHSHVHRMKTEHEYWYMDEQARVDNAIFNDPTRTVVTTSGNNGIRRWHGREIGYYSNTATSKNYITVGAAYGSMRYDGYPLRVELSSMGPTHDGRIKPDVMAPGDSHILPLRGESNPMIVELDSVAIIGESGNLKVGWGFQDGAMNWGDSNLTNVHKIRNVSASNGVLRYEDVGNGAYIWSDSTYKIVGSAPRCELNDTLLLRYRIQFPDKKNVIDSIEIVFIWRANNNKYHRGSNLFRVVIPTDTLEFTTVKFCLGAADDGDWKRLYSSPSTTDDLVAIRLDLQGVGTGGILAATSYNNGIGYERLTGTSMAAPHVTGVVALMLEKYKRNYLDPVGLSVDDYAFWNSTSKALLIHTATDMIKETPYLGETPNPDTQEPIFYHKGPDYATGWGMVNAKKAVEYVDTNLFKQDTIDGREVIIYNFTKSESGDCRVSLVWDDRTQDFGHTLEYASSPKLANNLDLHIVGPAPTYTIYRPWVLDPLPLSPDIFQSAEAYANYDGIDAIASSDVKPARRGIDTLNNVEVVDIGNAPPGEYTVVVTGAELAFPLQHFSLIADYRLEKDASSSLIWQKSIRNAQSGDTIDIPSGIHALYADIHVPDNAENVVLRFSPNTELRFLGSGEIWVGPTGRIIGAENITLSPQILQYNTSEPRTPDSTDNVIGIFGNLCDALLRGDSGRTTMVGPGIYNFNHVLDEGLIGVSHQDREKSSVIRMGFEDSAPTCGNSIPGARPGSTMLISDMRIEINGDYYNAQAMTSYGDGVEVYRNCIFEAFHSGSLNENVIAVELGNEERPLTGRARFENCSFSKFGTAVFANYVEQSPIFVNTLFENNRVDLQFKDGSTALCGLEANQIKNLAMGQTVYSGESDIYGLIRYYCSTGIRSAPPNISVADPGLVDPLISDFRLTGTSPLIAAGGGLEDIGAMSMNPIFTFSRFLDGRIQFSDGTAVQFENGALTSNTVGDAAVFRAAYTLNLRPIYEVRFKGNYLNKPSTVTVWVNSSTPRPSLPDEYVVWDANINGVRYAKLYNIELPPTDSVSRTAVPDNIAPAPVSGINIVEDNGDVVLTWNQSPEPDVARYKIFRAPESNPKLTAQIASLPRHVTGYRDAQQSMSGNVYTVIAYDSTGNMSPPEVGGIKAYNFTGPSATVTDTLRITREGVTIQINNPDYMHGAMVTVRNRGHNDSLFVEWYGVTDQNNTDCQSRRVNLFGNGAQTNNITSHKRDNGVVLFSVRSATEETYLVDVEIFNWANGAGCR